MSVTTVTIVVIILLNWGYTDCTLPVLDPRTQGFAYTDVDKVCQNSFRTLYNLFRGVNMMDSFVEDGITIKPAEVPEDSPCYGMKTTCCLPNEEKGMLPIVELENHQKLQSILEDRLQSCSKLGRHTENSLFYILDYGKQIFDSEIATIVGVQVPKKLSDRFFQFLFRFVHALDFCQLTKEIEQLMKEIYNFVINTTIAENKSQFLDSLCAKEFERHFIDTWYNSSVSSLLKSLNIMRLISESYQLTKTLVTDFKQHKYNRQCISGLFRLRHCSYCVGNHYDIQVCDGHCINTFRGCMVDMYELRPSIANLEERLQSVTQIALSELAPVNFVQSSMMEFMYFARHLKRIILQPVNVVDYEMCNISDANIVAHIETDRFIHNSKSIMFDAMKTNLKNAIKKDMICYTDIKTVLSELDESMCDVNPKHLKYNRNNNCWNGTHSKGSYDHPLVGKANNDQINNPAYKQGAGGHIANSTDQYKKHRLRINRLIHEISQTNEFYECIKSDDEDCNLFVLECKTTTTTTTDNTEFQLSSGSGSGSGSGQHSDIETVSQSILLQLGTPRRYLDINKNTNHTINNNNTNETTTTVTTTNNNNDNDHSTSSIDSIKKNSNSEQTETTTITTTTTTTTAVTTTTAILLPSNKPEVVIVPPPQPGSGSLMIVYNSVILLIMYTIAMIVIII